MCKRCSPRLRGRFELDVTVSEEYENDKYRKWKTSRRQIEKTIPVKTEHDSKKRSDGTPKVHARMGIELVSLRTF